MAAADAQDVGAALGSVAVRRPPAGAWPPVAERQATELSTRAVLGILAAAFVAELLVFIGAAANGLRPISPFGPGTDLVVRQLVVPGAITLAISLGIVLMLGWGRATGIARGTSSRWGVIPFAALWVGSAVTMGLPGVWARGMAFLWVVLLGLAFAAAAEEILFRGFLLHGLTRTMGGSNAVLLSSAIFAAAHLPSLVASRQPGGTMALTLLVLFGLAVLLCRIRMETGSIWLCSGIHALWNFVTLGVVGGPDTDLASVAIVAVKLVPVVVGIVLAVRLARHRHPVAIPPTPAFPPIPAPPPAPSPPRPDF